MNPNNPIYFLYLEKKNKKHLWIFQAVKKMSEEKILSLQKEISTLEWDIPFLKNEDIKIKKKNKLEICKKELENLARKEYKLEAR